MNKTNPPIQKRQDHEPLPAISQWGWRFHHLGIPPTEPWPNEKHLPHLKMHVPGFDTSPFGVEWMRFDNDCPVSELVRTVPHLTFEVDDLDAALEEHTLLGEITSPSPGAHRYGHTRWRTH